VVDNAITFPEGWIMDQNNLTTMSTVSVIGGNDATGGIRIDHLWVNNLHAKFMDEVKVNYNLSKIFNGVDDVVTNHSWSGNATIGYDITIKKSDSSTIVFFKVLSIYGRSIEDNHSGCAVSNSKVKITDRVKDDKTIGDVLTNIYVDDILKGYMNFDSIIFDELNSDDGTTWHEYKCKVNNQWGTNLDYSHWQKKNASANLTYTYNNTTSELRLKGGNLSNNIEEEGGNDCRYLGVETSFTLQFEIVNFSELDGIEYDWS